MSWLAYRNRCALQSRMPSMMDAWFRASEMMASSGPKSDSKTPPLASKQLENRMVSSVPRNFETLASEFEVEVLGAADEPDAGHAEAAIVHGGLGRGDDLGVVGQAQVVVGAEVQDGRAGFTDLAGRDVAGLGGVDVALRLVEACGADVVELVRGAGF